SPETGASRPIQLLTLSARTPQALDAMTQKLAAWLDGRPETSLADVAYTLKIGRRAFSNRRCLACRDVAEAIRLLSGKEPARLLSHTVPSGANREVIFMFAGGGAQYAGMGRELYETEPTYRAAIDECLGYARTETREDVR